MRSDLFNLVVQSTYLHYFFELDGVDLPLEIVGDIGESVKDLVVGPDVPLEELSLGEVAARLRLMGVVDLSRENLEARFASHTAILHLETATVLLTSLKTFARLKPSDGPRRAAALAVRYRDALMGVDVAGKVELARSVADLFRKYQRQVRDRRARLLLEVYIRDATALAEELPLAAEMHGLVYGSLGYPLPPLLRRLREPSEAAEAEQRPEPGTSVGNLAIR